jgi:lactate dehydrogenase-like 2-hydroxyacid dehydrogenase
VGILGLGGIGSAIATRMVGFGCVIACHNRRKVPGAPYRYAASPVELAESVDVLVVATTGTRERNDPWTRSTLVKSG